MVSLLLQVAVLRGQTNHLHSHCIWRAGSVEATYIFTVLLVCSLKTELELP